MFTVPATVPTIVTAIRTDATSALMEWEPLSLEQLRGNLTSYEIVYTPLAKECPPHSSTNREEKMSVQVTQPTLAITDMLDPGQQYCVGIAANTGAGTGIFSYEIIPCKLVDTTTTLYAQNMSSMSLLYVQGIVTACFPWYWMSHPVHSGL